MLEVERDLAGIGRQERDTGGTPGTDLARRLADLRRWWWLPVLCTLVAAGYAYAVSRAQPDQYDATASLLFRDPAIDQRLFPGTFFTPQDDPERKAATNVRLVSLDAVARRVATGDSLGLTPVQVHESVKVRPDGNSDLVAITARRPTPEDAAALANRYATEYVAFRRDADRAKILQAARLLDGQLERLGPEERGSRQERTLAKRAAELETLAAVQTGNAEIVEQARPPENRVVPRPRRSAMLGGAVGLLLGLGIALLLTRLDQRLRNPKEISALLGVPVLAEISSDERLAARPVSLTLAASDTPEAFRTLRTTMRYLMVGDRNVTTALITSAAPGEGKTTASWNLALAATSDGDSVLLIEADMRRPYLLPGWDRAGAGLASVLAGLTTLEESITSTRLSPDMEAGHGGRLDVLTAGERPPNPLQLLQSSRMRTLLQDVAQRYDFVVIDTPAVAAVADALALVRDVDGVVVVTRLGHTTRGDLDTLGRRLDNIAATVLGVVVNDVQDRTRNYYADSEA